MYTRRAMLSLLTLAGALLSACRERRNETPETAHITADSTPPASAGTAADSTPSAPSGTTTDSASPAAMLDVTWQWVSFTTPVEHLDVDAPARYTVRFGSDGRVTLEADCNRGTGSYAVTADRRLTLKPIALTAAMCAEGSLSDRFAKEVGRATSFFMKDGDLYLELPVDSGTLRFRREP